MTLLGFFVILALLAALGPKFGVDSREAGSWSFRDPHDDGRRLRL